MPIKWKIFRVVNYFYITSVTAFAGWIGWMFLADSSPIEFILILIPVFYLPVAVLLGNAILNAWLIEKCYPEKYPGENRRQLSITLFIFSIIILAGILTALFYLYSGNSFTYKDGEINVRRTITTVIITGIFLTGAVVISMQAALWKNIRRNHRRSLDQFLEPE